MRYDQRNNADPNNQLLAKNFPGDITIDQIRGYFRQFGRLEDVQITFAHDGPGACRCSCVSGSRGIYRLMVACPGAAGTALITYTTNEAVQQAVSACECCSCKQAHRSRPFLIPARVWLTVKAVLQSTHPE